MYPLGSPFHDVPVTRYKPPPLAAPLPVIEAVPSTSVPTPKYTPPPFESASVAKLFVMTVLFPMVSRGEPFSVWLCST